MKYSIKGLTIIVGMLAVTCINLLHCQTIIKPGNISGIWTKKTSPYIIKGDINIPAGKALIITPGVVVRFDGPYLLNVQGSLMARGTEKDSIVFTVTDTTGIKSKKRYGWNGIHFDRRPITWDTTYFRMPDDEMLRKLIMQYIEEGKIDTMARICISLTINDAVNDATLADSIFRGQQFSELTFCHFEFGTAMGRKQPYVFGGAVYIYRYSNLLIQHCTFENNFAYAGGAVYCKEAAPVLIRNHLRKCRAQSSGGAMVFVHSEPILVNNLISDNNADFNGGGILFYESYPCMVNNRVFRNQAKNSGGGMFCEKKLENFLSTKQYSMTTGTKFERNKTFENVILKDFHINSSDHFNGQFQNNLICQNKALTGAGIGLCATNPELVNMTIADNYADIIGGGIYSYHSAPKVINSILYGNMKDQVFLSGKGVPVFTYCNIEKDIAGIRTDTIFNPLFEYNNILNASPDFCNPSGNDYSLTAGSPCIDAGMPDTISFILPQTDLMGNKRVINRRIDLGAIEFASNNTLKSLEENLTEQDSVKVNDEQTKMFLNLFPNPSHGSVTLVIRNNIYPSVMVRVFASSGKPVYVNHFKTGTWFEHTFNFSVFPSGIYVIMVYSGSEVLYKQEIIIE